MTEKYFTSANDGLVSVESTKLANMKDHIVLEVGHASIRYDKEVTNQILYFIKNGRFDH